MARTLSLDEFAKVFPQFSDELLKELNYSVRQEAAKEALTTARSVSPVAKGSTASFITIDGRTVRGASWLTKGSISKTPGELKRAWRVLRGSRSVRGVTRVVNSGHAAIANEPYRRLPKGGAVGSRQNPEGMTPKVERQITSKSAQITDKAVTRTEQFLARKFRT